MYTKLFAMEAMLSVVAPSLFPALERSLQVAFVTGYALSWRLNTHSKAQNKTSLPLLPSRGRPRRHSSKVRPCMLCTALSPGSRPHQHASLHPVLLLGLLP